MAYWTYQVDPTNFMMESMLAVVFDHGGEIVLQPRDGENQIAIGDLVYLCEDAALKSPGVLGLARVTTLPGYFEMPGWQEQFWIGKESDHSGLQQVKMQVTRAFHSRILRSVLQKNPILQSHPFADYYRGTMRALEAKQATELDRLAEP